MTDTSTEAPMVKTDMTDVVLSLALFVISAVLVVSVMLDGRVWWALCVGGALLLLRGYMSLNTVRLYRGSPKGRKLP